MTPQRRRRGEEEPAEQRSGGRDRAAGRAGRSTSDTFVALLDKRGRFLVGEPFFDRGRRVVVDRHRDGGPGKLAFVRAGKDGRGHAKVVRIIGRPDVARDVLEALMLHRGLPRCFPPGVERAAAEARDAVDIEKIGARRDLRDLPTFTIDPVTAKDFDDAISAEALADGTSRIWVHIADVSAYVRPGSPVDREAYRRGTSVYVPGAVEPMIPEALSNDACSLVPARDRLAVTVELDFQGAAVKRAAFYRSVIRSDERLDYDRVDRVFAGDEPARAPWAQPLAVARDVAKALAERRADRALAIAGAEPEFVFDPRGHVTSAMPVEQTEAHRVIEHLMIAANEQVATVLADRRVPTLYRVHESPEPLAVERLVAQLASLGVPTPAATERMSPQQAGDLVAEISHLVAEHVRRTRHGRAALTSLVLRSLKQAHYSPHNRGHAGLASPRYCHFTSPIRRYPDLICHRSLLSAIGAGEDQPPASGLEEAGAWTSARERDAMSIERAADNVARCFLLERVLFEQGWEQEFDGEVIGLIGAGAFVALGGDPGGHEDFAYEGLLPVRRLRGDWWELNEEGTILYGTRSGATIRLGDAVRVVVRSVDPPRGRADLDVAAADIPTPT